jgi:hypothetical protein
MTFGILRAHQLQLTKKQKERLTLLGTFNEHKTNTHGFDFEKESLEEYVQQQHTDPTSTEGHDIPNWADWFAANIPQHTLYIVSRPHPQDTHTIIQENYDLFEVYAPK